jgi:hypothetical protein
MCVLCWKAVTPVLLLSLFWGSAGTRLLVKSVVIPLHVVDFHMSGRWSAKFKRICSELGSLQGNNILLEAPSTLPQSSGFVKGYVFLQSVETSEFAVTCSRIGSVLNNFLFKFWFHHYSRNLKIMKAVFTCPVMHTGLLKRNFFY